MGCGHGIKKFIIEKIPKKDSLYETYQEINAYTFSISMYNLTWKKRPDICIFQLVSEEVVDKSVMKDLNIIIEKMTIFPSNKMQYSINENHILFYIFCSNGVIITRNKNKINYYISNYLDNIISLAFVDISLINLQEKEYFSIYEIKRQTKYFFSLNMKEVDFSIRNKLTNDGKLEQLSDFEEAVEEDDIEEENEKKNKDIDIKIDINHFNGEYMKNEEDNDFLGIKSMKKRDSVVNGNMILDVNSILSKNNNKLLKEIKEYQNNDKEKEKEKKNKEINKQKNKSKKLNKLSKNISAKNINNKNLNIGNKNNKIKDKRKDKNINSNSKSKEKYKNDKSLFKNKKETHKTDNMFTKINQNKKEISTIINDSNEKKDLRLLNFHETNKNLININDENNNNLNNGSSKEIPKPVPKAFKIKDNILIISTNKLTKETNSEIQKILFTEDKGKNSNDDDNNKNTLIESPYDHINYYVEKKKNTNKKQRRQSIVLENILIENNKINIKEMYSKEEVKTDNDYIIIYNKNKIPFEKKKSSHKINIVYFEHCEFNTESLYFLKELISMLVKYDDLKKIYFNKNYIHKDFEGWKFLKQVFREKFNLRWITFKICKLSDQTFESIMSALLLKRIKYLNFSNNSISNRSMYLLNTFLIKNQTLLTLDLSHNPNINKEGIKPILISLKLHPNIYKIDFSCMQLNGSGEYIAGLLNENKTLNILILKDDKLTSKDIQFIQKELSKIEANLKHLDLSENVNIGTEGLKEIGKIINNNKSLKSIALDGMNLSLNNYLPIFNGIFKNKNIEYYSMSKNEGLPLKGLLNFFQKNPQIKKINIIPWDRENEDVEENEENKFTEKEIFLLEKFHLKVPNVILEGINFIDS